MNAARLSKLKSYFKSGKKGLEPSLGRMVLQI